MPISREKVKAHNLAFSVVHEVLGLYHKDLDVFDLVVFVGVISVEHSVLKD